MKERKNYLFIKYRELYNIRSNDLITNLYFNFEAFIVQRREGYNVEHTWRNIPSLVSIFTRCQIIEEFSIQITLFTLANVVGQSGKFTIE